MRAAIILTSYNRPRLVREAIQSVLDQSYQEWQLLVMDDGSNQETRDSITSFDDPRIVPVWLERTECIGCRYAMVINEGLERLAADTEFVTYLTDDDLYLSLRLEKMVEKLDQSSEACVVYGKQRVVSLDGHHREWTGIREDVGVTRSPMCRVDHNSFMHRKLCLEQLEKPYWPLNDWRNGDAGFFTKLSAHWDFVPIPEILDVHRWHRNTIQSRMILGESPVYESEL